MSDNLDPTIDSTIKLMALFVKTAACYQPETKELDIKKLDIKGIAKEVKEELLKEEKEKEKEKEKEESKENKPLYPVLPPSYAVATASNLSGSGNILDNESNINSNIGTMIDVVNVLHDNIISSLTEYRNSQKRK